METGKVKFFNKEKGFGFIVPNNGDKDLFVHVSGIENAELLNDGDSVEYNLGEGRKGPCAVDVKVVQG